MDLVTQYQALARYNTWMNQKLYALCATLTEDERERDRGAFFRSIHGTLNHLLLTDRVQLGRFIGAERTQSLDANGKVIPIRTLDQELYADFEVLRHERGATDAAIEAWVQTLTNDRLAAAFVYRAMADGQQHEHVLWWAVTHFFNHQTHHRGQLTTLLMQLGHDPGVTDLMAFLRSHPA